MSDNLENNNMESVNSESILATPGTPEPTPISVPPAVASTPSGGINPGLTSFTPEEVAAPNTAANESVSPIENLAKKEVVTRPLLWGVVVFLIFFALVIGAVSVYRYYQAQNKPVQDAVVLPTATPTTTTATTQSTLDTIPVSTNTKVQADAISTEIQSIDTDIKGDALSDTSLGL